MTTLSAKLTFNITHAQSLKDKRAAARSLIDRARRVFNASVAEVDTQDMIKTLTLGVAVVSGQHARAQAALDAVVRRMEDNADAELISVEYM